MSNNTLATAKEISLSFSAQTLTDSVSANLTDYFQFQLKSYGSLSAVLDRLGGDANLELIQDRDRNGLVSNSEILAVSNNRGTTSELVSAVLEPGTYYLRVSTTQDSASYNLNLSSVLDLKTDLTWRNYATGENAVWQVKDGAIESYAFLTQVSDPNWKVESVVDFNHDGQADLLWRNYATGENAFWLMNNNAIESAVYLTKVPDPNWKIEGVVDFNHDGQVDLLWRNYATGENAFWLMNNNAIESAVYLTKVPDPNWKIEGVVDFNHDGQVDLLWRNYTTGENAFWLMNNNAIESVVYLTKVPDPNWKIEGVVDYNQDGQVDVLWRNYATGENAFWLMNNNAIESAAYLTKVSDPNWHLVASAKQFEQKLTNDVVGNTIASAFKIGTLDKNATFRESLGSANDLEDDYQFTLAANSSLNLTLKGLSANVDLQLLNSRGEVIQTSAIAGNSAESISSGSLSAGTYYVRLSLKGSGVTGYTLDLAAALPIYKYEFAYYYNGSNSNKDSYTGYVYAYADTYSAGQTFDPIVERNETGCPGKYLIKSAIAAGNAADLGNVFVNQYYNSENATFYTPVYFGQGKTSGTNYLGSEYDFIGNSNSLDNDFGLDKWVYNVSYSRYDFAYYYNGKDNTADYYSGWVYAQPGTYTVGSFIDSNSNNNEIGANGKYSITKSSREGTASDVGKVFVDQYHDVDNSQTVYTPYYFGQGKASGTNFLGSEYDYARSPLSTLTDFGQDSWEFDAQPELSGAFFDVTQVSVTAGDSLTANFRIQNTGADAQPFRVAFYLSKDTTITTSDRLLATYDLGAIASNTLTAMLSKTLALPGYADSFWAKGGTDSYYIGMIVDSLNGVSEANETNNANRGSGLDGDSVQIAVVLPQPDLKGTFFESDKAFVAGSSLTTSFQVQNIGAVAAGAFRVGFYLSSDSTITTSDRAIGFYDINALNQGSATSLLSATLALPGVGDSFWKGNRTYYIGMVVDALNAISESNEGNNANQGTGTDSNDVFVTSVITNPVVNYGAASGNASIEALLNANHAYWNTSVNGGVITYSFYSAGSGSYSGREVVSEVSTTIKNNVRSILSSIEAFINIRFVEVVDSATSCGAIRYMYSDGKANPSDAAYSFYAYGYYPGEGVGGDVHLNPNQANSFEGGASTYGYMALIHETLHTLGLKHPGSYNAGGGTTEGPFLSPSDDNTTNTVMTYNNGTSDTRYSRQFSDYAYGL